MDQPGMVQLLTPEGDVVEHPDFRPLGSVDELVADLRNMVLARRFDTEATALQRHGELALWPPSLGQEGAQVGSARALRPQDVVFPSYREHAVAFSLGVPMKQILATFRGCDGGAWEGVERFRNYQLVIGTQALHATGYAMGMLLDQVVGTGDEEVDAAVIVYHGDGAISQGDVNEAYAFAASHQAPVVFFCQNNQWAISGPVSLQSRVPLYQRASGFGFPGVRVDGNDVVAARAVTEWALTRARRGEGPTLVEAFTFRMGPHTTADDPRRYQAPDEAASWTGRDPVERLRRHLLSTGAIDQAWWDQLEEESHHFGATVRGWVKDLPVRSLDAVLAGVYAEPSRELEQQRAELASLGEW